MLRADRRIVVSHVGSLVRPPAMISHLEKIHDKEPYDESAFEKCLTDFGRRGGAASGRGGHRRRQRRRVRQIGQLGLLCPPAPLRPRPGGHIRRKRRSTRRSPSISGRDREAFPEFYGEYYARVRAMPRAAGRAIVTGAITYTGQAELQRDIANLKAGLAKVKRVTGFLPVVAPASALPNAKNEHYRNDEAFLFGLAEALGDRVSRHHRCRPRPAGG